MSLGPLIKLLLLNLKIGVGVWGSLVKPKLLSESY
jgi:hypothetical protein